MSEVATHEGSLPATVTPTDLLQIAVSQGGGDLDRLERLWEMQTKYEAHQARKQFSEAMAKFRGLVPVLKKDKHVYFEARNGGAKTDYWHTSYGYMVETVNPLLSQCDLTFKHIVEQNETGVRVECVVSHSAGHSESVVMLGPLDGTGNKNAIQQMKSTVTYLKRGTLEAALGLASEDDDGQSAEVVIETITEEQALEIDAYITEHKLDRPKFMAWLKEKGGYETLEAIYPKDFDLVMKALRKSSGSS